MRALTALLILVPALASAQVKQPAPAYSPKTVIKFGEEEPISAGRQGPSMEIVEAQRRQVHNSMLRFRDNFDHKVLESVKELP